MLQNPGVSSALAPVEGVVRGTFLPPLLGYTHSTDIRDYLRTLFDQDIKQGGLGLRNPTLVAHRLYQPSCSAISHLTDSLAGGMELDLGWYWRAVQEAAAASMPAVLEAWRLVGNIDKMLTTFRKMLYVLLVSQKKTCHDTTIIIRESTYLGITRGFL